MNQLSTFKLNKNIFLIVILSFGLLLVFFLKDYFTAFLGSLLFYVLFKRWMSFLVDEKKWKSGVAAILIISVSFFIILLPITLFVSMVYNKLAPLISNPELILPYINHIDALLQKHIGVSFLSNENLDLIKNKGAVFFSGALNQGMAFFETIVMMYFFLYFLLINFNKMENSILLVLPFKKDNITLFSKELKSQTFSNSIGIPLIALAQGSFAYIIYLITSVPEAGFWAILTGFASIIPIVGTGIIWLPVCIYLFSIGSNWQAVVLALWSILIMGSMDNVIRFLLAKKMSDVHPVVTILGIIIGLQYMGITGLIFGPLLISYYLILLKIYLSDYHNLNQPQVETNPKFEINIPFVYHKKF